MKNIFLILSFTFLLFSCDSDKDKKILVDSSGRMNHILVVINNADWQSEIGDLIRESLAIDVVGLPQSEPLLHLNQIAPQNFTSFLKHNRNLLMINYADSTSYKTYKNAYADPQKIIKITAKNKKDMQSLISKKSNNIIQLFKSSDIKVWQRINLKNTYKTKDVEVFKSLGIEMQVPYKYGKSTDNKEYAWFVKHIPEGYLNLLIYSIPITSEDVENGNTIIEERNKRGYYVPGIDSTHITTESAFTPFRYETKLDGKKTYKTLGKWMMIDDYMAGPFLNYSIVDKKNNRLIVVEGFTYAPNVKKRDYMFELEAILKTIKIKN